MKNIVLICCCIFSSSLIGQDLETDLRKMHETYNSLDSWSMEIKVKAFKDIREEGKLFTSGKTMKKGDKIYKIMEKQEMVVNGEEMLIIDHKDREIILGNSGVNINEAKSFDFSLDSMLAYGAEVDFIGINNGIKTYSITVPDASIGKMVLSIDKQYMLRKLVYFYEVQPGWDNAFEKVESEYINKSLTVADETYFDFENYILTKNKFNPQPVSKYKNYRVVIKQYDELAEE